MSPRPQPISTTDCRLASGREFKKAMIRQCIGPFREPAEVPRIKPEDPPQDMPIQTPEEPDAKAKDPSIRAPALLASVTGLAVVRGRPRRLRRRPAADAGYRRGECAQIVGFRPLKEP